MPSFIEQEVNLDQFDFEVQNETESSINLSSSLPPLDSVQKNTTFRKDGSLLIPKKTLLGIVEKVKISTNPKEKENLVFILKIFFIYFKLTNFFKKIQFTKLALPKVQEPFYNLKQEKSMRNQLRKMINNQIKVVAGGNSLNYFELASNSSPLFFSGLREFVSEYLPNKNTTNTESNLEIKKRKAKEKEVKKKNDLLFSLKVRGIGASGRQIDEVCKVANKVNLLFFK